MTEIPNNCIRISTGLWTLARFRRWHYNNLLCCLEMTHLAVDCVWNVMAPAQKPDFVFRQNGRVHLNWQGRQFSRLLAAEVCTSAVVMLNTPCSEEVWRVLAAHSISQYPLQFPYKVRQRVPSHFNWNLTSTQAIDIITIIPKQIHLLANYCKLAIINARCNAKKKNKSLNIEEYFRKF